jgi:hypothetical protein
MDMKRTVTAAVAAIVVLCSNLALADNTGGYTENNVGKDQSVIFKDDPLAAGGLGPNDVRIRVMPSPKRVLLLRPRTQFVSEMLKSVEQL